MRSHQGDATDFGRESMRATQLMIALVAGLSVLTLVSGLAAQQSTSSNGTKLQRTDRNFVTKAAEGGRMEVELGQLAQGRASSDALSRRALPIPGPPKAGVGSAGS